MPSGASGTEFALGGVMKDRKLLIVDDDPHLVRLLEISFRDSRYETWSASSGNEAIDLWKEHDFDVVLLDLILPYYGGFRLCQTFRGDDERRAAHVLIMTGDESDDTREMALECGADDLIHKPFDPRKLVEALETLEATTG
jgi:two-component system, OmpR family, alkaline phosphatase synthesis response regulator PhoP